MSNTFTGTVVREEHYLLIADNGKTIDDYALFKDFEGKKVKVTVEVSK